MSQRQPLYRRPSWAQSDASYKLYMRKDLGADRSPGHDFGLENFSYDPAHVPKWQAPEDLARRLPDTLRAAVMDWEYAGAAVCTALERIKKLDYDSLYRGYPDKSRSQHHLSRQTSSASPAAFAVDTPPTSSPCCPTPLAPPDLLSLDKLFLESIPRRHISGMESPPFTPTGTQTCSTPDLNSMEKGAFVPLALPDAQQLTRDLSPVSMNRDPLPATIPSTSSFDENAWECFLGTYKAELIDIRQQGWVRFKGCGYTIDRIRVELGQNRENHDVLADFNKWWAEMKPKVQEYEDRVRQLQEPSIELVRMERVAQGLAV